MREKESKERGGEGRRGDRWGGGNSDNLQR